MPFSIKQREFLDNADHRWNIKTGATRSGKTYMDFFVIPKRIRARAGKDGLTVILGVTKSTIERNILEPMRQIWGKRLVGEINSRNIAVLFGEKVYCLGAEKVSQVSKLRGASIKYCYGDEVADWNEEVFEILKSRLDKPYSCFDGALNPQSPHHWLKKFLDSSTIDIYCQKYTIFDNPFLDKEIVKSLCNEYAGSVYYKRYILGEWCLAEGLVYEMFSREKHVVRGLTEYDERLCYYISCDYGTVNPFALGLWAFDCDSQTATQLGEVYYSGRDIGKRADDEAYYKMLDELAGDIPIECVVVDPSAASFIEVIKKYGKYVVKGAENDVLDGIRTVTRYLNCGVLKIHESCEHTLMEFESYSWDDKSGEDKVIKENDHAMDEVRYFCYTVLRYLLAGVR